MWSTNGGKRWHQAGVMVLFVGGHGPVGNGEKRLETVGNGEKRLDTVGTVSYTHLTLPTICSV
eukprot:8610481-Alexandrium_andersonii.AAC.1